MEEGNADKISEAIFNLIPEVTRLKELFQNWDKLDEEEREFIDTQVEKWNSPAHVQLYKTVKKALNRWGKVQDTEGAPGCEPGWFTFSCDSQLEEELINVLQTVENLLKRMKQVPRSHFYHLPEEMPVLTNLPEVPPSSPGSESDDFLYLGSPVKQRSEPLKTCGRSLSLHSGRTFYHNCHAVKSAPLVKDGYNTD
ncbi:hypothetical protein RUM43_002830 [Polyplax serrata]|uniref:Uncharacterized protein n=1 Tax=Polyplax serrata TaxID=468196 RepID=A0AAN8Q013_POLSC